MDEFEALANELASEIDPSQGRGVMPDEQSIEDIAHEELEAAEEAGNDAEDSDAQVEADEGDDEASEEPAEESEEESEESESEEEETEEESAEDDGDDTSDESNDDVSEDLHKVTVDGEEVEVSLQDLKDNYAGQQAWDKKFTELNNEREEHQARVEQFNGNAKQFQELVDEGKAQEALDFVLETAGLDRNRFVEAYVSQLAPTIAEYLELSPEEREQRALKQQVEHYKAQEQRHQETQAQAQQRQALEAQVTKVMEEHGIEQDRFEELQKELIEFGIKDLTPETVGQYHVMVVQQDMAVEVLNEINPELVKDKSAMDYLLSLQQNNTGISKDELKTKAEKAFVDALSERVKKDSKATKPRKKGSAKTTQKKVVEELLTFDDLENINPLDLLGE